MQQYAQDEDLLRRSEFEETDSANTVCEFEKQRLGSVIAKNPQFIKVCLAYDSISTVISNIAFCYNSRAWRPPGLRQLVH